MRRIVGALVFAACSPTPAAPPPAPTAAPSVVASSPAHESNECGALGCRFYDSPEEAFLRVLADKPRVLAVGEAHAQKGSEDVASATRRFREQLLPKLQGRASDLVIELMVADGSCRATQEKVAEVQKPVVERQAEANKSEFVLLGEASDKLGIRPHVLRPSCDDYQAVVKAGDDGVVRMLAMIAELTANLVHNILERNAKVGAQDKMVLAYGGALHNDVAPAAGRETWSFGPQLKERTAGRYVELDLIVPELIKDTDSWRAMSWYAHYRRDDFAPRVVLFNPAPGSYVLVFAQSKD